MRVVFNPESERAWAQYYSKQAKQSGAGFIGLPYQRGAGLGSIFRGIFRALLPVAKSAGKAIGKQALSTGAQIASDVVAGESIKAATKKRGTEAVKTLLKKAHKKVKQQTGTGLGRRPKRKSTTKPVRKRPVRKRAKLTDQLGTYYR